MYPNGVYRELQCVGRYLTGMQPRFTALALLQIAPTLLGLAAITPVHLFAVGDCRAPSSFCQRLEADMVVFIGRAVSVTPEQYWAVTVTFDVQEILWGPPALRSIRVLLDDGYGNRSGQPEFFAVKPLQDGRYIEDNCIGLNLPATHPFVDEFRRGVAARRPASIAVKAQWRGYVPVAGTEVNITGNGKILRGTIHDDAGWLIPALAPGLYTVTASRPNFSQTVPARQMSILPASCADLRILMAINSEVTGRVVDAHGEPIRNATFHLSGQGRALSESRFSVAFLRDALFRRLGWAKMDEVNYPLYNHTRTDNVGRFSFRDVFPGWYYLSSDISELNTNFQIPLPNVYYPGVYGWPDADQLVAAEGQAIHNVLFRLPDFGQRRRITILVSSEDGAPVAGAIVQDSGLNPGNQAATNSGAHKTTDAAGQVILSLWAVGGYRLTATLWGAQKSWSGDPLDIPPGYSDLKRTIILRGLRLKRRL